MFDFGFSEMLLIAVVALVVLGPERLPKATRFAGLWVRRARNQWASVKDELERDLASEDLKRAMNEAREAMRGTEQSVRASADEAREEFEQMRAAVAPDPAPGTGNSNQALLQEYKEAEDAALASFTASHDHDGVVDDTHTGPAADANLYPEQVDDNRSGSTAAEPSPEDERRNS